jgi:S-DNA-T family DNA segregation ATPase FtsK/SpoIIIE
MVAEVEQVLRSREASVRDRGVGGWADVFLVIDGWAGLRQEFEWLEEPLTAIAVQGLSLGVHVVVSASRWAEIRPSLKDQLGTRIELRLGDPADSEVDRRRAREVPQDRPGRGLSRDGLHMLIARPGDGPGPRHRDGDVSAPPIPLLPLRIDHEAVVHSAGDVLGAHILLGVDERRLQPVAVDFGRSPHLLVLGDSGCGKTGTLRTVLREIIRTGATAPAQLLIVDYRRSLLGVGESKHPGEFAISRAMSPPALRAELPGLVETLQDRMPPSNLSHAEQLRRSWWSGPEIYVVVDDYDLVATTTGNPLLGLLEFLPYAADLGLHLIVARRSGGAVRGLFEPLLAGLRELGCTELLMSGSTDEGPAFGRARSAPLPPGRGVLIARAGDERLVQVAWSPPR